MMVEVIKSGVWHNGGLCTVGDTLTLPATDESRLVTDGWCKAVKKADKKSDKRTDSADAPTTDAGI